jgi:hypothetical protein
MLHALNRLRRKRLNRDSHQEVLLDAPRVPPLLKLANKYAGFSFDG